MATEKEQVQEFLSIVGKSLHQYVESIDFDALSAVKKLILDAEAKGGRLHVTGIGKPGHVSGYAASLFSSTGTPTYELHGTECVHGSAGQTRPGDVVIAISNSGETGELKATVTCLKNVGVHIIALTGNPNSWLANEAEVALIAGVEQEGDSMNKPPRASILAEIMELQCLSILLQTSTALTQSSTLSGIPAELLARPFARANNPR